MGGKEESRMVSQTPCTAPCSVLMPPPAQPLLIPLVLSPRVTTLLALCPPHDPQPPLRLLPGNTRHYEEEERKCVKLSSASNIIEQSLNESYPGPPSFPQPSQHLGSWGLF